MTCRQFWMRPSRVPSRCGASGRPVVWRTTTSRVPASPGGPSRRRTRSTGPGTRRRRGGARTWGFWRGCFPRCRGRFCWRWRREDCKFFGFVITSRRQSARVIWFLNCKRKSYRSTYLSRPNSRKACPTIRRSRSSSRQSNCSFKAVRNRSVISRVIGCAGPMTRRIRVCRPTSRPTARRRHALEPIPWE